MKLSFSEILEQAIKAAEQAVAGLPDSGDCGFAWVHIENGRHPFVSWCRKQAQNAHANSRVYGEKHYRKGWEFWNPSNSMVQSRAVLEAGAKAFAEVLKANGIECREGSRAD